MAEERPQITLVTPPAPQLESFPDLLAAVLDAAEVACLRLALAGADADALGRMADACRAVAHERDIAVVIDRHAALAERHGLDGVHLTDGARGIRDARKLLGADGIVGAFCGGSKHEGITAGEAGADYVSFGPVGGSALGPAAVERELFEWWSEMIEVPVVAEGALSEALLRELAPVTDFVSLGEEVWSAPDPAKALKVLAKFLG